MGKATGKTTDLSKRLQRTPRGAGDAIDVTSRALPEKNAEGGERKAERTREFIRAQSAPLFNKQGFAGTSLGDLTEATGLSKGALYGNFKDKEDIALASFAYSMQRIRQIMDSRLKTVPSNKQKLLELLNFFAEYVMHPPIPGGCPMMNYGVESDDSQRFMRKAVAKEMQSTVSFVQRCLENGIREGEFHVASEAASVARVIFCAIEGAIVVSRVTGDPAPMAAVVTHCKLMLESLSVNNNTPSNL